MEVLGASGAEVVFAEMELREGRKSRREISRRLFRFDRGAGDTHYMAFRSRFREAG